MDKIAVFISKYSIGNSPSIINLLELLSEHYQVYLYLNHVSLKEADILQNYNITVFDLDSRFGRLQAKISTMFTKYDSHIAIDPHGFVLCKKLFPNSQPFYYSLELYMSYDHFGLDYPKELMEFERREINSIRGLMIQSDEKDELFREDYGLSVKIPTFILPVTYLGPSVEKKSTFLRKKYNIPGESRIALHLGGISEWHSCIEQALAFAHIPNWYLFFQGHRQPQYYAKLKDVLIQNNITNVILSDEVYNSIEDVNKIIQSCDLGIGWYNDISIGFRTVGKSSGKISSYLRFGLPIVAKKYRSTYEAIEQTGCGICIDEMEELPAAVGKIEADFSNFSSNARNEYDKFYNFENYKEKLIRFFEEN